MLPSSLDIPSLDPARVPGLLRLDHGSPSRSRPARSTAHAPPGGLGFREIHREDVHGVDQVREVLLAPGDDDALGAVQLLEPLADTSPVARQIEKGGGRGGLVHVAYRVRDAQVAFAAMAAQGQRVIDAAPRPGSRGTPCSSSSEAGNSGAASSVWSNRPAGSSVGGHALTRRCSIACRCNSPDLSAVSAGLDGGDRRDLRTTPSDSLPGSRHGIRVPPYALRNDWLHRRRPLPTPCAWRAPAP